MLSTSRGVMYHIANIRSIGEIDVLSIRALRNEKFEEAAPVKSYRCDECETQTHLMVSTVANLYPAWAKYELHSTNETRALLATAHWMFIAVQRCAWVFATRRRWPSDPNTNRFCHHN